MQPPPRRRSPLAFFTLFLAGFLASLATAPVTAFAQGASNDGERLFRARCGACHSLEPGQNRVGPHLAELADRIAGTIEGARYSAALQDSGTVWTAESLDVFLASPRQAIPGTTMSVGLANAGQRAAIIDFLLSADRR